MREIGSFSPGDSPSSAAESPAPPATADLPSEVQLIGPTPLRGELRPPGDKSVSHRALLLGAMAEGTTVIRGLSGGEDVRATRRCVELLGAAVTGEGEVSVRGGFGRWHEPVAPLDCGNSGTSMRLLTGAVAACGWTTELTGDASLSARPMDRVAAPLEAMGATVAGRGPKVLPPLRVSGGPLEGLRWQPPVASAQVKSAVLLAGVRAEGATTVDEPVRTRTHTEEMLAAVGADIAVEERGAGRSVTVRRSELRGTTFSVPADPSQAAFWGVAAAAVPGSSVLLRGLYGGPERLGWLGALRRMGAAIGLDHEEGGAVSVTIEHAGLRAATVEAGEIPSLDEVPALAVAAAVARGVTRFRGMGELRVKESDRLLTVQALLSAFGAVSEVDGDDLLVEGRDGPLAGGAIVDSAGDHRIAMAAAVAASAAAGETTVTGFRCVGTSYPSFLEDLGRLGGRPVPFS